MYPSKKHPSPPEEWYGPSKQGQSKQTYLSLVTDAYGEKTCDIITPTELDRRALERLVEGPYTRDSGVFIGYLLGILAMIGGLVWLVKLLAS